MKKERLRRSKAKHTSNSFLTEEKQEDWFRKGQKLTFSYKNDREICQASEGGKKKEYVFRKGNGKKDLSARMRGCDCESGTRTKKKERSFFG